MEEVKKEVKKNKKKNKVASLLLALALILTCGVAGTIAQYQKSFTGSSTAEVANFNVTDNNTVQTNVTNLFKTNILSTNANTETNVKSGKIAPGTKGYAEFTVTNSSEVNTTVDLTTAWNAGSVTSLSSGETIPLKFKIVEGTTGVAPTADLKSTSGWNDITAVGSSNVALNMGDSKTYFLCWQWEIGTDPTSTATDTAIGEALAKDSTALSPKVDITVKVTQVD